MWKGLILNRLHLDGKNSCSNFHMPHLISSTFSVLAPFNTARRFP